MATNFLTTTNRTRPDSNIAPALLLMAVPFVVGAFLLIWNSGIEESFPYFFILPWLALLAIVLLLPSIVLYHQGKFTLYNPLVFATFSYFFPAFVVGGISLASGWSQPYFLSYIQDAEYNLPFTIVLIALGFAGLSIGYFLPFGRRIGEMIDGWLPHTDYEPSAYVTPALVLLGLGLINTVLAFALGILGFQKAQEIGTYDGLIFLTTLFWMEASFMLWLVIFKRGRYTTGTTLLAGMLAATALARVLFSGSRGVLLTVVISIGLAYLLSGREFKFKQAVWAGALLMFAVVGGMIYGSTFRSVKGTEERQDIGQYTENIFSTFEQVGRSNTTSSFDLALTSIAERLDGLSSVAVVVSNYEQLAPYEEGYGLDSNIQKDLMTFLIPRVIWPDKPVASEPRRYSDLYFNYSENSFTITPMGDLLRNYGVPGIFIGMLLLGILLRSIYRALIEDQQVVTWHAVMYFMLLTAISYESFYGSIVPYMFKVGTTTAVGLVFIHFLLKRLYFGQAK